MTTLTQRYPAGHQFFSNTGAPLALGRLHYYQAGTSNDGTTYKVAAGTGGSENTNPIILNSAGRLEYPVYLGTAYDYKEALLTAGDVAVFAATNNIPASPPAATVVSYAGAIWPNSAHTASAILTVDDLLAKWINAAISAGGTLTLPSAVTAGSGYGGIISKSISAGTLTLDTQSAQTINGASTLTLTEQYDAYLLLSDGANWRAFEWLAGNTITSGKLASTIISGLTNSTAFDRAADYFAVHDGADAAPRKLLGKLAERYPDAVPYWRVVNQTTATPPGAPSEGDAYVVATAGTGAWSGWDGSIAHYFNSAWKRETPAAGWLIWDVAQSGMYAYSGAAWQPMAVNLLTNTMFTTPHGAMLKFGYLEEEITLSGATTDSTGVLPNQSVVFGCSARVTELITSGAGTAWTIGPVGGGAADWGSALPFTLGTTNQGVSIQNHYGEKVRITCTGGTFTGGKVRITAFYATLTPATS